MQKITFKTEDEQQLAGILIQPKGKVKTACVLHSATGVPKEFYVKFAQWLAEEHNAAVLLYDYRGFGESLQGKMRDAQAKMSDWGIRDQSAALDDIINRYPDADVWAIGHSLGGIFLNAHRQSDKISRAFGIASGANYWRRNPLSFMPSVMTLWWLAGPAATCIKGYLPGKKLGLGSDLPKGVYWQWRKWCLSKEFYRADYGKTLPPVSTLKSPQKIRLVSIESDKLITASMVKRMRDEFYAGLNVEYEHLRLKDIGAQKIGHVDIFREQNKKAWPLIIK